MTRPDLLRRAEWAVAILLSAAAIVLLLIRVTHAGGLWRDECGTVQLATMPTVSDVIERFDHQTFPPLVPLLVRAYVALFGQSDSVLRAFGLFAGVAFLFAIWFSARAVHAGLPLLSLSLFGLSPVFLTWGTTVSGYGLGIALIILAFGLTASLLVARTPLIAFFAFAAALLSQQLVISNLTLVLTIEVTAMVLALLGREFKTATILAAVTVVSVLVGVVYLKIYSSGDWRIVLHQPRSISDLSRQFTQACAEGWLTLWIGRVSFVAVVTVSVWRLLKRPVVRNSGENNVFRFSLIVLVLAPIAYLSALFGTGYRTQPWHYLLLLALLPVAMDQIVITLPKNHCLRLVRLSLAVLAAVTVLPAAQRAAQMRSTNADLIADRVEAEAKPHDLIILAPWQLGISFNRYYQGATRWITLPEISDHQIHRYDLLLARMISPNPIDDVLNSIRRTLESGNRVWFVGEMRLPKSGKNSFLPPAPHSSFGWDNSAYSENWLEQVTLYVRSHTTQGRHIDLPHTQPVNAYENVPLMLLEGWQ